jgi:hypothetical protein
MGRERQRSEARAPARRPVHAPRRAPQNHDTQCAPFFIAFVFYSALSEPMQLAPCRAALGCALADAACAARRAMPRPHEASSTARRKKAQSKSRNRARYRWQPQPSWQRGFWEPAQRSEHGSPALTEGRGARRATREAAGDPRARAAWAYLSPAAPREGNGPPRGGGGGGSGLGPERRPPRGQQPQHRLEALRD